MQDPELKVAFIVALLLLATPGQAGSPPSAPVALEFSVPAQMQGQIQATTEWVLLLVSPEETASVSLSGVFSGSATNRTYFAESSFSPIHSRSDKYKVDESATAVSLDDLRLSFHDGWGLLFIQGPKIHLKAGPSAVEILRSEGTLPPGELLPTVDKPWRSDRDDRRPAPPGPGLSLKGIQPSAFMAFTLKAEDATTVEWHNATTTCSSVACLDGARGTGQGHRPLDGTFIGMFSVPFIELSGAPMDLHAEGFAYVVAAGGPQVDVRLDGNGRFPETDFLSECSHPSCNDPAGRTLKLEGRVELEDLRQAGGKRLQANAAGSFTEARFDEERIPALMVGGAAAGAAVVGFGLVVLVKAFLGLFARNTRPVLEHPRAKAIHQKILETPGLRLHELRQQLGYGHGTTQYHLQRLLDAGHLVAYEDGSVLRYYENHGRHQHDWQAYAAWNKPGLRELHEWIAEHPHSNQRQVIDAMAKLGWKRGITQHRLKQLVEANLLSQFPGSLTTEYVARPTANAA